MLRTTSVFVLAFVLASCETLPEKQAPTVALEASHPMAAATAMRAEVGDKPRTLEEVAALDWPEPQRALRGFDAKGRPAVWDQVYVDGGTEVYCRKTFSRAQARNKKIGTRKLNVEHAYPAKWIAKRYGCANRDCAKEPYKYAEADLHNLWPSYSSINSSRGDGPLGMIDNENRSFTEFCPDYERLSNPETVEPDENARGDFARSILYMHHVYGVAIDDAARDPNALLEWIKKDPPDSEEREREATIRAIQHTWNPLVMPRGPGM